MLSYFGAGFYPRFGHDRLFSSIVVKIFKFIFLIFLDIFLPILLLLLLLQLLLPLLNRINLLHHIFTPPKIRSRKIISRIIQLRFMILIYFPLHFLVVPGPKNLLIPLILHRMVIDTLTSGGNSYLLLRSERGSWSPTFSHGLGDFIE